MPVKKVTRSVIPSKRRNLSRMRASNKLRDSSPSAQIDRKRGTSSLSVSVYSLAGRASTALPLPKEIFGGKVNKQLLSQAMRVYMTNQRSLLASTKTRGEVEGSTAKIYRQKGTGRARHGGIRAPIFVGGGIVFGPKPRKIRLDLPKKMRKAALFSALSSKLQDKNIFGLIGIEKASGKTKEVFDLLKKINPKMGSALIVTPEKTDNVVRAARNIPGVTVLPVGQLNAFEVLRHQVLILSREAVAKIGKASTSSANISPEQEKSPVDSSSRKRVKGNKK